MADPAGYRPDGWYRVRDWGSDWRGWQLITDAEAEAEIAAGAADLVHLTFGIADPVPADPAEFARCLTELQQRFARNLPAGWTYTPYVPLAEHDDKPGGSQETPR